MTDPLRPDDELVSAVLDGEATADERARVAAEPALAARARELAAVRELVAAAVPDPDPERREAALAAARAAHRSAAADAAADAAPAAEEGRVLAFVRDPAARRFLAVAAGVLLVLLGAGALVDRLGTDTGGDDAGLALDAPTAGDGAEGADEAGTATGAPLDLGPVADEADLTTALIDAGVLPAGADDRGDAPDALAEGSAPTTTVEAGGPGATIAPVPGDGTDCQVRLEEADPARAGVLVTGTATYAGTPAVVYVFGTADGGRQVVVVSAAGCAVLTVLAA